MQKAKSMKNVGTLGKIFAAGAAAATLASPLAAAAQPMTQPPPPGYQSWPDGWHGHHHEWRGPGDRRDWGGRDGWRPGRYDHGQWAAYQQAYADWARHYDAYYGYYREHPVTYQVPIITHEPEVYERTIWRPVYRHVTHHYVHHVAPACPAPVKAAPAPSPAHK
jgi:hypothetical protein